MKAVILAGGLGTRISEETHLRPKPMIEIGGMPILWHIMKIYSHYGINDFIICAGYKGYVIKEFFSNYFLHATDVEFDFKNRKTNFLNSSNESWKVKVIDTGAETQTGGRLKKIIPFLKGDDQFLLTYGDGLSDVNISNLMKFHKNNNKLATVTAVEPPGRYGALDLDGQIVKNFKEKPNGHGGRINGGFFVLSTKVLELIEGDNTVWEEEPLKILAKQSELMAFFHDGFWQPMDTLRERNYLNDLWSEGSAPWKTW